MIETRRTWIELSRSAWRANLGTLCSIATPAQVMPIVKANAYGHGLAEVLSELQNAPIWGLGVAHGEEALQVRKLGYQGRVMALSTWESADLAKLAAQKVIVVVHDFTTLEMVQRLARRGTQINIQLKLDSGTARVGFRPDQLPFLRRTVASLPRHVTVSGVFTHVANAEEASGRRTQSQLDLFDQMRQGLPGQDIHAACTAALWRYQRPAYTVVRPGIGLFGVWPSAANRQWAQAHRRAIRLRPVLSWWTRVVSVKRLPAGASVGYGSTWRFPRAGRLAVLPVGYADGLRRSSGNRGWVVVGSRRCPIIGRVCMNLSMIDVTKVPTIRPGQLVQLIGPQISVDDHADWVSTISYDILTGLAPSIPRLWRP